MRTESTSPRELITTPVANRREPGGPSRAVYSSATTESRRESSRPTFAAPTALELRIRPIRRCLPDHRAHAWQNDSTILRGNRVWSPDCLCPLWEAPMCRSWPLPPPGSSGSPGQAPRKTTPRAARLRLLAGSLAASCRTSWPRNSSLSPRRRPFRWLNPGQGASEERTQGVASLILTLPGRAWDNWIGCFVKTVPG